MNHVEHITPIVKLDLKLQCYGQVYVIKEIHIYLLKEAAGAAANNVNKNCRNFIKFKYFYISLFTCVCLCLCLCGFLLVFVCMYMLSVASIVSVFVLSHFW